MPIDVELLYTELVGRVAFPHSTWHPHRRVNYAIVDDAIVWRTAGLRHRYMRTRYQHLTGRRLGHAAHPAYSRTAVPPTEGREVR